MNYFLTVTIFIFIIIKPSISPDAMLDSSFVRMLNICIEQLTVAEISTLPRNNSSTSIKAAIFNLIWYDFVEEIVRGNVIYGIHIQRIHLKYYFDYIYQTIKEHIELLTLFSPKVFCEEVYFLRRINILVQDDYQSEIHEVDLARKMVDCKTHIFNYMILHEDAPKETILDRIFNFCNKSLSTASNDNYRSLKRRSRSLSSDKNNTIENTQKVRKIKNTDNNTPYTNDTDESDNNIDENLTDSESSISIATVQEEEEWRGFKTEKFGPLKRGCSNFFILEKNYSYIYCEWLTKDINAVFKDTFVVNGYEFCRSSISQLSQGIFLGAGH